MKEFKIYIMWAVQKLSLLISLLQFCISFVDWFMASFLYCFPYSYRSSNYCNSNSCRSFTFLKAIAKSKSISLSPLRARKSNNFYLSSSLSPLRASKSDNYLQVRYTSGRCPLVYLTLVGQKMHD